MALIIHKSDIDGRTGMLRLRLQVESPHAISGQITRGPVEHAAIYPQALANLLGPSLIQEDSHARAHAAETLRAWLEPRHQEMQVRKRIIEIASGAAVALGERIEFGEAAAAVPAPAPAAPLSSSEEPR